MDSNSLHDLDRLIDEALRSEPLQPLPETFERRMQRSLHMAARVERERRQLRKRLLWRAQLVAVAALGLIGVGVTVGMTDWLSRVPGILGFLDYASADTMRVLGLSPSLGLTMLVVPAALMVFLSALPLVKARMARVQ
ncbi:MAG: hypothetical protein GY851_12010 [bacterium]|nr:hypothetical protein [bacterium]